MVSKFDAASRFETNRSGAQVFPKVRSSAFPSPVPWSVIRIY